MTLMGRKAAIDAVQEVLTGHFTGGSRTVLVEGPSGCGKSAVVDAVVERASAAGAVVLNAVCFPGERETPLSLLRQLIHSDRSLTAAAHRAPDGPTGSRAEDMQDFCARLRELSADAPVVICVDDVQHADDTSLDHLQYLARHIRSARVVIMVTVALHPESRRPAFVTELMRRPDFRRVELGCLTRPEVCDTARAAGRGRLAAPLHDLSGGNPLLLRALIEECTDASATSLAPRPGGPYAMAVAACLHRSGPAAASVAQACALLGPLTTPQRVARMLGVTPDAARQALSALEASGVLKDMQPRHPAARAATLSGVSGRGELHRRAALALCQDGCPAGQVADHLLAAAHAYEDDGGHWTATAAEFETLREAAEAALADDDAHRAVRLLQLARAACVDESRRAAVDIRLAVVAWRFDPSAAERHLDAAVAALRGGRLDPEQVQPLTQLLLVQGRCADVVELFGDTDGTQPYDLAVPPLSTAADGAACAGEPLLRSARLAEATLVPIRQALSALVHSDHPERALPWSGHLIEEAERRGAPGWQAAFATLHAQALLRTGDLAGAGAFATRALEAGPEQNTGAFAYTAAAVLIRAWDAMGQYTDASRRVDQPMPRGLLETRHGLAFLRARGLHQLTAGQPQAALADFLEAGRLMRLWGIDSPAYLPWRTDAAEALLRLGRPQQADQLAAEQLALPDGRRPWVRGLSLHLRGLAASCEQQRVTLLTQARAELERSGDRLATARVLADLGRAAQPDGTPSARGQALLQAAWQLAKECEATPLCREILPDEPLGGTVRQHAPQPGTQSGSRLSNSEQRVATLAAQGLTNREISAKLYLTVSTVEQHLTKVYRKLRISSRGDLPLELAMGSSLSLEP
ncbi:helix-turn-helix transcriptional regulator [Streptomyces canus]|uniref:helix-turn-helix transcriptional regulator n=1 Tax=Streptomyces canus TaxID=58343 RepID=UPI002E35008D|nr:AAA family ATPase [Streptomyces canus]